jgi:peptide/nickel transport system substrate-binding protein
MHTIESRRPVRPDDGSRSSRRAWTRLAAAVGVLGLLAAGCGDPEPEQAKEGSKLGSESQVANVVKPAEGAPKPGGTLRVGLDAETNGWDPTKSRFAAAGITVGRAIYDPLVAIDANMKPQPYLAESLTPSDNFQTWDIKLRQGIKFHSGEDLNAAAVVKFLETFRKSPAVGSSMAPVASITETGPLVLQVKTKMPWAQFPIVLAVQPGLIAAPSQLDSPDGNSHPVGTGPFKFESWSAEKSLVVTKNASYWRKGLPYLDKIDFRPIADDQTRYKAFQSGDVDVIITPREQTIQNLAKDGQAGTAQVIRAKGDNDVNMLMLNTAKPPFNDIRMRQAIAHAIDRTQLLSLNNSSPEVAATSVYTKSSPWYTETKFPEYDPEKAKSLIQQVEAEKGKITLTISTVPDQDLARTLQLLQQQLQQVGIEVKLDTTEQAALINKAIAGDYTIMTWRQFGSSDPDGNFTWWIGENADSTPALNMARNKDPEIDKALLAGRATQDDAQRKEYYATIQKRLAEDLPYVFTTHLLWTMGTSNKVRNLETGTLPDGAKAAGLISGVMPLNEMWLGE